MTPEEMSEDECLLSCASNFWPEFWRLWCRRPFYLSWCTIKITIAKWRDTDTDSFWWFVKSCMKIFNRYFILVMIACVCISEFSYLIALRKATNWNDKILIEPLYWALPALIGTTILDYFLDFGKRKCVSLCAILLLLALGYWAWFIHDGAQTPKVFYLITFGVVILAAFIKVRDPKMTNIDQNAASVYPDDAHFSRPTPSQAVVSTMGKKMVFERAKEGVDK